MRITRSTAILAIALAAAAASCGDSPTAAPAAGSLIVSMEAASPFFQPTVRVTGPHGYDLTTPLDVGLPRTLANLPVGTYTIAAPVVTVGGHRFVATPATQDVSVGGRTTAFARGISYAVVSARLTVSVLGLPAGASPSITVTGPGGFTRTLAGTTQLELLEPGSYTIAASSIDAGGRTYRASATPRQVVLAASMSPTEVVVAFGAGRGTLDVGVLGLPPGTNASVSVTGPGGFARMVKSATRLEYLDPGTYTISASTVGSSLTTHAPAPSFQEIAVADGDTSAVTITYGSAPLVLGLQPIVGGLTQPVFLTAPVGDARLFIVERPGYIRVFADGALRAVPFLDISGRVNNSGESGLLSIAFDPDYATNGYFYAYYVDRSSRLVVERFASTPGSDVAAGGTTVVITIPHGGINHHGGTIAFGPDGMLYLAPGDGGCCGDPQNNAQNTATLLGKVLRIDVRTLPYTIPAGNPYIGRAPARPEVWATGLRNPWRFAFDAPGGMLYIADVGQESREEVNVVPATSAGRNYGWRNMEGLACYNPSANCDAAGGFTYPVLDYTHAEGCSVTGGYVYRGRAIPELEGHYLYSDYCRGWLRSFRHTGTTAGERRSWAGITVAQSTSFGQDGAGELYMIGGTQVWKIVRR